MADPPDRVEGARREPHLPDEPDVVRRLREELARKADEFSILRQVSSRINTTLNLEQIQEIVLHTMHDLFGFSHALILLLDEVRGELRVAAGRGYAEAPLGARVALGDGVIGIVAQRKKMMRIGNLGQQRLYMGAIRRQMEASGQTSAIGPVPMLPGLPDAESQVAIPLLVGERLVGVFFVESAERRVFSERDETLVAIVANICASAIHNALLYRNEEHRREALEGTVGEARTGELDPGGGPGASGGASVDPGARGGPRPVQGLRAKEVHQYDFEDLVGSSAVMKETRDYLRKLARSPSSTILITGENGTGKDLAAKILHARSHRASSPFMNITCSALPESLLESELFGHERGAFTGAHQQKKGLLEQAEGGSVFLDEIGEMTVGLQAKLLRVLEEKAFKRVGGSKDLRVDVRIIAATNRDLQKMVREGTFREDLYFRLRVLPVELVPLRKHPEDIREMAQLFIRQFNAEFQKDVEEIDAAALATLSAHPWPGNVRELRNAVERAMLLAEGRLLTREDFHALALSEPGSTEMHLPLSGLSFEQLERDLVLQALDRAGWNQAHAAKLLGMPRDWLRYRIQKFGLRPPQP